MFLLSLLPRSLDGKECTSFFGSRKREVVWKWFKEPGNGSEEDVYWDKREIEKDRNKEREEKDRKTADSSSYPDSCFSTKGPENIRDDDARYGGIEA